MNSSGSFVSFPRSIIFAETPTSFSRRIALSVALRPALSISYARNTVLTKRDIIRACSDVMAVPSVATAFEKPACCNAIASTAPSHIISVPSLFCFAMFMPNSTLLFLNAGVSDVLIYFLSSCSLSLRPENATQSPFMSKTGNMMRFRNISNGLPFLDMPMRNAVFISSSEKPLERRWS